MNITHPLHLIEIQERVAKHVEWWDLHSCVLVCYSWSISFRPFLWCTVVVSSLGPDFSDSKVQDQLHRTRRFEFRQLPDSPLPIRSFLLTSLKISPVGSNDTSKQHFWTSVTLIILSSNIHLSSIELSRHQGTTAFWDALLTCTKLTSLSLSNLYIDRFITHKFWMVASAVESIPYATPPQTPIRARTALPSCASSISSSRAAPRFTGSTAPIGPGCEPQTSKRSSARARVQSRARISPTWRWRSRPPPRRLRRGSCSMGRMEPRIGMAMSLTSSMIRKSLSSTGDWCLGGGSESLCAYSRTPWRLVPWQM